MQKSLRDASFLLVGCARQDYFAPTKSLSPLTQDAFVQILEENFVSIPCDRIIARVAAHLRAASNIRLPDAIIAASALSTRTPLATRNIKDFKSVERIELLQI